jgi:hypothetical protein
MDDELSALETELKNLRPIAPSARLQRSIGQAIQPAARPPAIRWSWFAWPAVAAVIVGLVAFFRLVEPPSAADPGPTAAFKPVTAENVLLEARDEGYVTLEDGTRARRVRQSYVDTITWKNPRTHASLKWSVPREEVRIVPVNFQ